MESISAFFPTLLPPFHMNKTLPSYLLFEDLQDLSLKELQLIAKCRAFNIYFENVTNNITVSKRLMNLQ